MGKEEQAYKSCGKDQILLVLNVNEMVRTPYDYISHKYESEKVTTIYRIGGKDGKIVAKIIRKYSDATRKDLLSEELKVVTDGET